MTDINDPLIQGSLVVAIISMILLLIRFLLSARQMPKPYPGTDAVSIQDYSKWNPKEEVKKWLERDE